MEMIQVREKEIETMKEKIHKYEKVEAYEDITDEIKDVYGKLLDKGFDEVDAFELTKTMIESGNIKMPYVSPYLSYRR